MERQQTSEFVVGAVFRRAFRRALRSRGLAYSEDKGWFDSQFIVTGPGSELRRLFGLVARAGND